MPYIIPNGSVFNLVFEKTKELTDNKVKNYLGQDKIDEGYLYKITKSEASFEI